ncbi:MAG TPA: TIGR03086 family metal-binding protein [Nocardioidaceae bacterium]|nr:TIGR03086 family metal-binding protein [Nocardioidaceae bacterium]
MTRPATPAPLVGGVGLLERAMAYTLGSLQLVTGAAMTRPTPCADWDLRELLRHMNDSLQALHEAGDRGRVEVRAQDYGDPDRDPVLTLRNRACSMLGSWTSATDHDWVTVDGRPLTGGVVTATGALEIAVHGWDVARACGHDRPIPPALADELLPLARLLVTADDRPTRFAPPAPLPPLADPGARLLAFVGRHA